MRHMTKQEQESYTKSIDDMSDPVVVLSVDEYELLLSHKARVTHLQDKLKLEKEKRKKLMEIIENNRLMRDTQFY